MVCPGLDRGHCSCGLECCVTSQGTCVCPDCLCVLLYDRPRPAPILVADVAPTTVIAAQTPTEAARRWMPWPVG